MWATQIEEMMRRYVPNHALRSSCNKPYNRSRGKAYQHMPLVTEPISFTSDSMEQTVLNTLKGEGTCFSFSASIIG
jgi:hypothetical protein